MKFKLIHLRLLFFMLFLIVNVIGYSEDLGLEEDAPPTPSDLPIDGGISLLVGAGIAYGSANLYRAKGRF